MSQTPLEATAAARRRRPVIDLAGDVDGSAREALDAAYARRPPGAEAVVLDFARVDYINTTGIALIVGRAGPGPRGRHEVSACGLTDHYREIFEITRLSDFMPILADEAGAAPPPEGSRR